MNDYIDKDAALEVLNKLARSNFTLKPGYEYYLGALNDVGQDIKYLPSADVKPVVHGKWLTVEDTMWCGGGYWKCSNCDQGFGFAAFFEADSWPFCPNCGADMREVQP